LNFKRTFLAEFGLFVYLFVSGFVVRWLLCQLREHWMQCYRMNIKRRWSGISTITRHVFFFFLKKF
jgi:hypothetical protein